ncbi:MAG: asparagine synthase-related protein, partial [Candidatus Micrarchaeota archaeon]
MFSEETARTAKKLIKKMRSRAPLLVSFSGGVDSSVVAKLAFLASQSSIAVTVADQTVPKSELEHAKKIAKEIGITHAVVKANCMEKNFARNDALRCYYCKKSRARTLRGVARRFGITTIVDGINADDRTDVRPGTRAAQEEGIRSPL